MENKQQVGSSLVEVMVALFVLAIGLLGVLAMQTKSMQFNQSAHTYSKAVYLANDLAERIRVNGDVAGTYAKTYDGDKDAALPTPNCAEANCSAAQLASWDAAVWNRRLGEALPVGKAEVSSVALTTGGIPAHLKIEVSFDDSRSEGSDTPAVKTYTLLVGL